MKQASTPKPEGSPWGHVQHAEERVPGIWAVITASHGGLKVSQRHLDAMPEYMRETPYSKGLWFEEDCDWALVAVCFPMSFRPFEVAAAYKTMEHFHKDRLERLIAESPAHRQFYEHFNRTTASETTLWEDIQALERDGHLQY